MKKGCTRHLNICINKDKDIFEDLKESVKIAEKSTTKTCTLIIEILVKITDDGKLKRAN